MRKRVKKTPKKAASNDEVLEIVNFIKDRMVTKDDLQEGLDGLGKELRKELRGEIKAAKDELKEDIETLNGKVSGINRRLDLEAMHRDRLRIPRRVNALEEKTFGKSRHPEGIPL